MSYRRTQVKKLKRKSHNLQALQMRSSLSKKILKSKKEYSTAGLQNREISKTCHFDYPAFYHTSKCTSKNSMALLSLETPTKKKIFANTFFSILNFYQVIFFPNALVAQLKTYRCAHLPFSAMPKMYSDANTK